MVYVSPDRLEQKGNTERRRHEMEEKEDQRPIQRVVREGEQAESVL